MLLIALALVDLRLSRIMGVRLDWDVIAFGNSPRMMWRLAQPYLPGFVGGLGLLALIYALAVRGVRALLSRAGVQGGAGLLGPGAWYALASFVSLGLLGMLMANADKANGCVVGRLVESSPLWKRAASRTLSREEFLRSARALGLGDFEALGKAKGVQTRRDLNVVFIFLESSYNKHLSLFGGSDETEPLLSRYKDRMELFPNFFSNFAGSIHARFASFTGLYPVRNYDRFTLDRVGVKSLFEVLHDNHYACSLFYSSFFDYTGFGDFLKRRGIDEMYDADTMPGPRSNQPGILGLARGGNTKGDPHADSEACR